MERDVGEEELAPAYCTSSTVLGCVHIGYH